MQQTAGPLLKKSPFALLVNNRAKMIHEEVGSDAFNYIRDYSDIHNPCTYVISSGNEFVIQDFFKSRYNYIINLKPLESRHETNQFIKTVNKKLKNEGLFIGRYVLAQISTKKPNIKTVSIDGIPKRQNGSLIKGLTYNSRKNLKTKMNIFGKFYYFGFEIISEKTIGEYNYFVAKRITQPSENRLPGASPIIVLKRIGKNGKMISIYKLRTMYPYSEYLQDYIFKNNQLENGGKFKNDYRIIRIGNLLRKYWIDELPMLINLLKGDIKLFGVRPISEHYFSLYSEELKELRIRFKPGLIPPYYADLPDSFEAILNSEMKYLNEYQIDPYWTDFKYLLKALFNILIKCKRSK